MKIDLFITEPAVTQSVILIDGKKQFFCLSQSLQTWLANIAKVAAGSHMDSFSEATALLNFDRTPESRPLLFSQTLKESAEQHEIATFDFILCRSNIDHKWHKEEWPVFQSLKNFMALVLWSELPTHERFTEEKEGVSHCLVCGRENELEHYGTANMAGTEMYGSPKYCEWPNCFSHFLELETRQGFTRPDFTDHEKRIRERIAWDEQIRQAIQKSGGLLFKSR